MPSLARFIAVFTLTIALISPCLALEGAGKVAPIPLDVTAVATGGYWRSSTDSGNFRIVVRARGHEHLSTVVLLEKIGSKGILRTVVVNELSDSALFIVSDVTADRSTSEVSGFALTVQHRYEPRTIEVRLQIADDGTYKITSGWPPR